MAPIFFRSRPTRIDRDELRRRLEEDLATGFPDAGIVVGERDANPVLSWCDGPAAGSVAGVTKHIVNWEVRSANLPLDGARVVVIDRSFSPAALAVAVVRYRASHARPYDSSSATAVEDLTELLEVDGPERSGYPVADAVATLLLAAPDPESLAQLPSEATGADRLAAKLTAIGYDSLWAHAWSELS